MCSTISKLNKGTNVYKVIEMYILILFINLKMSQVIKIESFW